MLVDDDGGIVLSDFGFAGLYQAAHHAAGPVASMSMKGTEAYMDPKIHAAAEAAGAGQHTTPYNIQAADKHALAMSLLHMLMGSYSKFYQLVVSSKQPNTPMARHIQSVLEKILAGRLPLFNQGNLTRKEADYCAPVVHLIGRIAGTAGSLECLELEAQRAADFYACAKHIPSWCRN